MRDCRVPNGARQSRDDDEFWAHQSHGLAVIVVAHHVWTLRLAVPVGPSVHVGDRVPLMPLLAAASQPRECLVLALAEGSVRLIDCLEARQNWR